MKLKKFLLILLAAVSCACLGFAFGCVDDNPDDGKYSVDFSKSEHVRYVVDGETVEELQLKVDKNSTVTFSVEVEDGFLPETLVVKANNETLAAAEGVYSHLISENVTITASVSEDLIEGSGTEDVPYLISSVKDLRTMADMVNSGYSSYVTGYYRLENDIDCGGAQLEVIGHFENQYAFFAGIFDGQNHTISNYTIETNGRSYVGLFGCVQISTSTTTVMISNLNLKDFKIEASAGEDNSVCVGSIAAFSAGANIVSCSAEGEINVYAGGYFSYVGGAVGVQQSLTLTAADNLLYHYHASTEYVHTNVVISSSGYVYTAGGIVGYSISSHERGASMILNSYSEGNLFGAMRSGGIVGTLEDYSSVANCYSRGYVSSTVTFNDFEVDDESYFAYAGGIIGYAGVDTSVSDSFTTSITEARATNAGKATGDIYAGGAAATDFASALSVVNCYSGDKAKPTDADFIKNDLKWRDTDWVIKDGSYPTTNYTTGEYTFDITLNYGNYAVNGNATEAVSIKITDDSYFAFSSYLEEEIDEFIVADREGYASFGFFFDENCTEKVPYSFVPTRGITLYVGFADYSEVAGSYEYVTKTGRTVNLIVNPDATYQYVDVGTSQGTYVYDGEKLIFNDALFARLSDNVTVDEVAQPWLNFQPYKFAGTHSEGKLYLYDGVYFTNDGYFDEDRNEYVDNRLIFGGETVKTVNSFLGTWERSATINEKYTFNEDMTWSYSWKGKTLTGSYSVTQGVATMTGGITAIASIDASGLLLIEETGKEGKYYNLENSFLGNWYSSESGAYLVLNGYGTGYAGSASAIIDGTVFDNLAYVKDGFFDGVTNNRYTYTILSGYVLFGYFTYDAETKTVTAMFLDESIEDFIEYDFILLDYYLGEWIGEEEIGEHAFTILDFNGLGLYKAEGDATLGYVVINGTRVPYECTVESGLDGTFTYAGETYALTTNGDGTVNITLNDDSATLYRKDEMASMPLTDDDDNIYEFNGGGHLTKGGILTVTSAEGNIIEYAYKIVSGSVDDLDIVINLYDGSLDGELVGNITIEQPKFVISINGQDDVTLDLYLPFAGRWWSISVLNNSFFIGKFDLTYEAIGTYNGTNNVPFVYYPEYNYVYIFYGNGIDGYVQMYLLLQNDGNLIVSTYPYVPNVDAWYYAAPSDELVGSWVNTETRYTLQFDGLADSMFTVGEARNVDQGLIYMYTRRFGKIYMWLAADESVAYTVELSYDDKLTGENVYRKDGAKYDRIVLTETDVLNAPIFTATAGDGTKYEFGFDGSIKVGENAGTYLIDWVDGDNTTVVITVNGKTSTAVVNHTTGTVTVTD